MSTMLEANLMSARRPPTDRARPHRPVVLVVEAFVALGGFAGTALLLTGTLSPPVSDLAPLGLSSWVLPGLWLLATVPLPATTAAWLAWRRAPLAPAAVLVASATMAVEVLVQIPFVGPNPMQAVFGCVALGLAVVALDARRKGWWHRTVGRRRVP